MPNIEVAQPFTLTLNSGEQKLFSSPGTYEVTDEVASHPYTQHFLVKDGQTVLSHPHEGQTAPLFGSGGALVPETPISPEQKTDAAAATLTTGTDAPEAIAKTDSRSAKKVS